MVAVLSLFRLFQCLFFTCRLTASGGWQHDGVEPRRDLLLDRAIGGRLLEGAKSYAKGLANDILR